MRANLSGKLRDLSQEFSTGKQLLTIELAEDFRNYFDEFKEKDLSVEIKPKVKKRTNTANSFLWATLSDISEKTQIPPEDIYKKLIPDVGGNYDIFPVKNSRVEIVMRAWQSRGIGWLCRVFDKPSKHEGYTNVVFYLGSSQYDREQMARIIDLALQEAREQGIPPRLTQAEIQATIERWGEGAITG